MNPRLDNTRVISIEYPNNDSDNYVRESSPLAKLVNEIFGTNIKDIEYRVALW